MISYRRTVIVNYIGQGWTGIIGLIFIPVYVRLLGVEAYGLIGVYSLIQAWLSILDFGLVPTLSREIAIMRAGGRTGESVRDLLRTLEYLYSALTVVCAAAIWALAPYIADHWLVLRELQPAVVVWAFRLMGLVVACRWLEQVYRGALMGMEDQVWLSTMHAFLATLRWGGAALVLAVGPRSIILFFAWQGLISAISVVAFTFRTYKVLTQSKRRAAFDPGALIRVSRFAGGMFLGTVLTLFLTQSDKLVISKLLPLGELGLYSIVAGLAGGLAQLTVPLNNAMYPRFTREATLGNESELQRIYGRACELMAAVIVPPAILVIFFSEKVLLAWTGNGDLATTLSLPLKFLMIGAVCNGLMNLPYMLQLAHGWIGLSNQINGVAVVVIVPGLLWAVPRYGILGAAIAWALLNLLYVIVTAQRMHRRILVNEKVRWYKYAVLGPVSAACLVAIMIKSVMPAATTRLACITQLTVAALLVASAVVGVLPTLRHEVGTLFRRLQASHTR